MHASALSCSSSVQLFAALQTCLPWVSPGKNLGVGCHDLLQDLPNPGIELESLTSSAMAGGFFTTSAIWEAP